MKRNAVNELIKWKENGTTVPFLLIGTKGTGKTYLAMEFASAYYPQYLYVNFELNVVAKQMFCERLSKGDSLAEVISAYFQIDVVYLTELVVVLDEISFCPTVEEALINQTNLPIIAISGKIPTPEVMQKFFTCRLYPLGFDEFLSAVGSDWYIDIIQGHFQNFKPVPDIVHQELLALFEEYLLIGGMPAAMNEYISSKSIHNVSEIHSMIQNRMRVVTEVFLNEKEAGKALQILNVLPAQLNKENKKFRFNMIRKGVTYTLYKESIQALEQCGMILRLNEQTRDTHFKLYLPDVGMLSSSFYGVETEETRKALLENYVMQTLTAGEKFTLCFWESDAQAKVDFILVKNDEETPVELRISTTGKAKSVASYQAATGNINGKSYRFGFENFYSTTTVKQIPYYAVFCVK